MNFVQNLEECLRDLATACRQKHPGVKEASERAIQRLRTLQTSYIRAVRSATSPDTTLFRSSDLLHPFLLAANYPNADYRLLEIAFRAMRLLMEADAVVATDAIHVIRVYQIQAQVVAAFYQKQYPRNNNGEVLGGTSVRKHNAENAHRNGGNTSSSSGSWFGWGSTSTTSTTTTTTTASSSTLHRSLSRSKSDSSNGDSTSTTTTATKKIKNAVSSSTGQTGYKHHHQSSQMDKLALEILSSLLQLLELLETPSGEVWRAALALSSLWLAVVPVSHTIYQAACTTVSQLVALLLLQNESRFLESTVEDLLLAITGSKKIREGALGQCNKDAMIPPSLALELLKSVMDVNPMVLLNNEALLLKTLGVTKSVLEKRQHYKTAVAWTVSLLPAVEDPDLFEELLATLVQPIAAATASLTEDECFEDGYVYDEEEAAKTGVPETLHMDAELLGNAALVLEQLPGIVMRCTTKRSTLAETLSDFIMLATSCRDHIRQVASVVTDDDDAVTQQPTLQKQLTLAVAVQSGLETMLLLTDEFSPSLAVFQHILKRFVGSKDFCETALEGYMAMMESNQDTNPVQLEVLLQSLAKLSITAESVRDMRCLVCLMRIIHLTKDHLDAAWIVELGRLEMKLEDSASLAVAAVYCRVPKLTTCLSDESMVRFANGLVELLQQDDWSLVTTSNLNSSNPIRGSTSNRTRGRTPSYREERKTLYSQDYQDDFSKRASALQNSSQMPLSLMILSDVLMANQYRGAEVTDTLMSMLLSLNLPALQPFCMSLMTSILLHKLSANSADLAMPCTGPGKLVFEKDPMQSQLWAVEPVDDNFQLDSSSQLQVLKALCDSLCTASDVNTAKASLEVLNTILEGTGQTLRGEVWVAAVKAIESLSGDESQGCKVDRTTSDWSSNCLLAFRTLKLIVDDFLDLATVSPASHAVLLDACSSFVASRHDINTSLTAIGLLWNIADKDSAKASISKFVLLAQDDRPEVRNAAVNTLFSCIVGQAGTFTHDEWKFCLIDAVFSVYDTVMDKMEESSSTANGAKAVTKSQLRLHHSRDSEAKLWLASLVLVLRGLSRVLRNNFNRLLNTIASDPWFPDFVWPKILTVSLQAAGERGDGGRASLEIRSIGIELLVLSCQLSCEAGIQAAIAPARVGTNMEVVNGALRSVREASTLRSADDDRSPSQTGEDTRRRLFESGFEAIEAFERDFVPAMNAKDDCDQQILTRFCGHIHRLYDCCHGREMIVEDSIRSIEEIRTSGREDAIYNTLEDRFVRVVLSILSTCDTDMSLRYLNQGQRGSIDLLRSMAANGSFLGFKHLVRISGAAFFLRRDVDVEVSEHRNEEPARASLLSFECANVVTDEIAKESVSDECRCFVLFRVLSSFLVERDIDDVRIRRHYKLFIPILRHGLESSSRIAAENEEIALILRSLWSQTISCFRQMMEPIALAKDLVKMQRVAELVVMVDILLVDVPQSQLAALCNVLSFGATTALHTAKQHSVRAESNPETDHARKSKRHRDELMKLFNSCLRGSCRLNPAQSSIHKLAQSVMSEVSEDTDYQNSVNDLLTEAAITICTAATANGREQQLAFSIFSSLCRILVSTKASARLKEAAGSVLTTVNVSSTMHETQARCLAAEERASSAEDLARKLKAKNEELEEENSVLKQQLDECESRRSTIWGLG